MEEYTKLLEALRCCASGDCNSENCDYMGMGAYGCMIGLAQDAAAAIDALRAENEKLFTDCQVITALHDNVEREKMNLQAEVKRLELDNEDYEHESRRLNAEVDALKHDIGRYVQTNTELVNAQPHWVSVEEPPKPFEMVVAYVDPWHIFAAYHNGHGDWKENDGFNVIGVRYWMPIEPPQEV